MKFYKRVWINENRFPGGLFEKIVQLKPECRGKDFFHLEAKAGDEANGELVERIVALCQEHGLDKSAYSYSAARHYEPADLSAAPFLVLEGGRALLYDVKRDEAGLLVLPAAKATASLKLQSVFAREWFVVSNSVRRTLESAGLIGLQFRATLVQGHSVRAAETPFWELTSGRTLPEMVNRVRIDRDQHDAAYAIKDDSFQRPEPHYRRSEIEQMGAFDVAHTLEMVCRPEPLLIISQRFYQTCVRNKVPLRVWAVRLEPE